MTYNDPYYYNYGRFGFNQGISSGWNSMGMGMGIGIGYGSGFGSSFGYGSGFGGMYGNPYSGFNNNPWGPGYGYYNPWNSGAYGYGGYGGYGSYYGGSGYYGPYGGYGSGYVPVTYGDAPRTTVVNHRPSIGSGSGSRSSIEPGTRTNTRNMIGLGSGYRPEGGRTTNEIYRSSGLDPARDRRLNHDQRIDGTRATPNRSTERRPSFEQRGTFDNGGTRSSPSNGGGGGTRGGGGGSISTPTRR